jgi:protein-disulfide isomerase
MRKFSFSFDRLLSNMVSIAVLVVAGVYVMGFLGPRQSQGTPPQTNQPVYVQDWQSYEKYGVRIGPANAALVVLELMDFECPFCRQLSLDVEDFRAEYPSEVAVLFLHYPLTRHKFAVSAAIAADCAAAQNAFEAFQHAVYSKQDSIGIKPWQDFAREAGLADVAKFMRCTADANKDNISAGLHFGRAVGLTGTPTVLLNGYKLTQPPTVEDLRRALENLRLGKAPIDVESVRSIAVGAYPR